MVEAGSTVRDLHNDLAVVDCGGEILDDLFGFMSDVTATVDRVLIRRKVRHDWPRTFRSEPISYEVGEFEALARLAFNIQYRF